MLDLKNQLIDVVTVGERGQIVIPAKARREFGIIPGDRIIVARGMGNIGIILVNAKNLSSTLSKISKSIGSLSKNFLGKSENKK